MDSASLWQPPPPLLDLPSDEVHVWRVCLDTPALQSPAMIERLRDCLSLQEQIRADRFYFLNHRQRYIVAHAALHWVLGGYLGIAPDQVSFTSNPYGKPFLRLNGKEDLEFNMSDSNGLALIAVTLERAIGVDIEYVRRDLASLQIAEKFFSHREVEILRNLIEDDRAEAFFNCWTRKEAYLKARGRGLSLPLDQFDVSLLPGEPAILLNVYDQPAEIGRWRLHQLHPGPGYVASLAVEGHDWQLKCWQWFENAEHAGDVIASAI